ncbi:ATP-binding cassette domain-containing protein [Natronococcus sp. A-GB1]|uniref:ATP-binding cassette domain-containing protein n=1 Tax=Natronococcus sp. A-GB1 TaxID=3037648 RepID=UPI00241DEE67|nr:ATP-binding cassette domain-containing protein [Natronococcus sp. A-GB1]MDG5761654.1 ATP-binding cassette domain-containing protein [Natronococcus sp. A-GB1]
MSKAEDSDSDETVTGSDSISTARTINNEDVLIRANDMTKHYGGIVALDGIDIEIQENEILSIVGDNGAGKSTFIKLLSGVIPATRGDFFVKGGNGELEKVILGSAADAQDAGIETVFQDMSLSKQHDVAANVFMGREPLEDGPTGKLLRRINREYMNEKSVEALEEIGFEIDPTATTGDLSGGQQQAVAVARALISDPDLVILDEPTAEVSVDGSQKILDLINSLQESGKTVLFVTHNMEEVLDVADRIAILRQGNLVTILDNDGNVDREDLVAYMTGALTPDDH